MEKKRGFFEKAGKVAVVCIWLSVILLCLIYRDEITVERILGFTPRNTLLAILVMLGLFTVKGCTVLTNGCILYAACGVMFSLPMAVTVNLVGSFIMTTIPYWIGHKGGAGTLEQLTQKYKKLELIREFPRKNDFLLTLVLRLFGLLPCEPVGMYLGACKIRYGRYIGATLLGLLPAAVLYAVMGEFASDPSSPQFIAAVAIQAAITVAVLIWALVRSKKKKLADEEVCE